MIPRDKLLVYHPGEYRRYLVQHPCTDCPVAAFCDLPCQVYLNWYNARMQAARIRAAGEMQDTRYKIQDILSLEAR